MSCLPNLPQIISRRSYYHNMFKKYPDPVWNREKVTGQHQPQPWIRASAPKLQRRPFPQPSGNWSTRSTTNGNGGKDPSWSVMLRKGSFLLECWLPFKTHCQQEQLVWWEKDIRREQKPFFSLIFELRFQLKYFFCLLGTSQSLQEKKETQKYR